ncbi:MAG: hypothetical protein AABY87_01260 [bacterium]
MIDKAITPSNYQPFEKLTLCGNTIINGKIPIAVDGHPVFLIGRGDPPKLWLNVRDKNNKWFYIVEEGLSRDENIRVLHNGKMMAIYLSDKMILQGSKEDESHMLITHIDLTSFGLEIQGDISLLRIGSYKLTGNTFENIETMVNIK